MNTIVEKITELIKEMLQGWVMSNLEGMFTDVNTKVGTIAGEGSQTPSAWNAGIFNMIKNLSDTAIIPIAGIIITYVLCYELITMVIDKNNMKERENTMENNNNVIATEVVEKQISNGKARLTAYMQGMKKLERKAQMQKEAMMKGGAKA